MAAHFGWPKITFEFLAISDQYATFCFWFFFQNGYRRPFWKSDLGHFGCPNITFDHISRHFRSIRNFNFFDFFHNGHFGCPNITFDHISRHFRSIRNFDFVFTKWLPAAILDDRKSPLITFLAISDQYATFFFFFYKMAAGSHFGWPKITFECISRHFRSIRNFFFWFFFSKWPPAAILEVPFGPFWITENHFWSDFSPFQINTQLFFFSIFFFKMADSGHFGSPICAKNNRVLSLCVINGYAKYEVDRWIPDTVRDATSFLSSASRKAAELF